MPTYEYECAECGTAFERFESITSKPNTTCPKCSKKKARRLISAGGGLLFKGSGFYCTDYRSASHKAGAKAESSSPSSGTKSPDKVGAAAPDTASSKKS